PTYTTPSTSTRPRTSSPARPLTTATSAYFSTSRASSARVSGGIAASSRRATIGARTPSKSRNRPVIAGSAARPASNASTGRIRLVQRSAVAVVVREAVTTSEQRALEPAAKWRTRERVEEQPDRDARGEEEAIAPSVPCLLLLHLGRLGAACCPA